MSWMAGVGPVKDINQLGISRGLSETWYSDTGSRGEIKKGNFWDIIDNPLYQVAAEAKGYDWAAWVKDAKGKVGTGPNDGIVRVRATIKPGTPAGRRRTGTKKGGGFTYTDHPGTPAEYEWMTRDEADERGLSYQAAKTTRWRNKETGEVITGHPNAGKSERYGGRGNATLYGMALGDLAQGSGFESMFGSKKGKDWEDNWEELRDWGSHDAGINEDLDEISRWLHDIVSINDHIPKIIREGPQGKHYGIEGDIWEHYGLDKEPEPPKEMEWDSYDKKMNLKVADKNTRTYSTPKGITPINLHGDD